MGPRGKRGREYETYEDEASEDAEDEGPSKSWTKRPRQSPLTNSVAVLQQVYSTTPHRVKPNTSRCYATAWKHFEKQSAFKQFHAGLQQQYQNANAKVGFTSSVQITQCAAYSRAYTTAWRQIANHDKQSLHDLGPAASFLGMRITRDLEAGTLKLDQQQYVGQLLDKFSMIAANGRVLPMPPGTRVIKEVTHLDSNNPHRYREQVGALLYVSTGTTPDIAFTVGQLSRFMQAPTQQQQQRTAKVAVAYSRSNSPQVQGFADADYVGDPDSMCNTTGSVFVLSKVAATWHSKVRSTVAASTTEAETQVAAAATKEA
ncbi:hypothetical protein QJQ45_024430 [Haematococcus lacustris]|nr:hypothetical protein QJQ45_024430 [Haematococcus lacustris]